MLLKCCIDSKYGSEKDNSSFCVKEDHYSYLTKCVNRKAMEAFLKENGIQKLMQKNSGKKIHTQNIMDPIRWMLA